MKSMMIKTIGASVTLLAVMLAGAVLADNNKDKGEQVRPGPAPHGAWQIIGTTEADQKKDHDTIVVNGPFDNFRKVKFKVSNAPLNMYHMSITFENGDVQKFDIKQKIQNGGESSPIDLVGVGQRRLRKIDFFYESGPKGKADVTVFGQK